MQSFIILSSCFYCTKLVGLLVACINDITNVKYYALNEFVGIIMEWNVFALLMDFVLCDLVDTITWIADWELPIEWQMQVTGERYYYKHWDLYVKVNLSLIWWYWNTVN